MLERKQKHKDPTLEVNAAGEVAQAEHNNAYCWGDGSAAVTTTAIRQYIVRATGSSGQGIIFDNGAAGVPITSRISTLGTDGSGSYTDRTGGSWTAPAPTNVADAINRLTVAVAGLLGGTIP